jgi:pimeloyl-ACP methyl ester carboxylesterase
MRWIGYIFWIAGAALFLWALAVAALWALQGKLIFQSDDRVLGDPPPDLPGFSRALLETADCLSLVFWEAAPQAGKPVILYFHGNGGNAGDRATSLLPLVQQGYGLVLAEYRGYGGNGGKPTEAMLLADGARYLAYVRQHFRDHDIVLWGESLGGGIALRGAAADDGGGLLVG